MRPTETPWDQRLAGALVRPLAATPVTPNMITTATLVLGLASAALFALGHSGWAGAAFVLALLADHGDGELARLTGRTTAFGHYYDRATSAVTYVAVFLGMGLGLGDGALGPWAAPLGLAAGVAVAGIFALRNLGEHRLGPGFAARRVVLGFEIEDVTYLIAVLAWLDRLEGFLVLAALGAPVYLLWTLVTVVRRRGA